MLEVHFPPMAFDGRFQNVKSHSLYYRKIHLSPTKIKFKRNCSTLIYRLNLIIGEIYIKAITGKWTSLTEFNKIVPDI